PRAVEHRPRGHAARFSSLSDGRHVDATGGRRLPLRHRRRVRSPGQSHAGHQRLRDRAGPAGDDGRRILSRQNSKPKRPAAFHDCIELEFPSGDVALIMSSAKVARYVPRMSRMTALPTRADRPAPTGTVPMSSLSEMLDVLATVLVSW